jgi:hypothetical protein
MAAASNQTRHLMVCPSSFGRLLFFLLFLTLITSGCVSLRVDMINKGAEVPPPAPELKEGRTTLTEVLAHYGAPTDILDMQGKFALVYKRTFYRGGQISFGIPLSEVIKTSFNLEATANLSRHDMLTLFFTNDGVLNEMIYEKGTNQPFWSSLWK